MPLIALLATLWCGDAFAHPIGYSALYAEIDGATVEVSYDLHPPTLVDVLPEVDLDHDRRLDPDEATAAASVVETYLSGHVRMEAPDGPCVASAPREYRLAADTRLFMKVRYRCPSSPPSLTWTVDLFMEDVGGHTVLGRFRSAAGYVQHAFTAPHRVLDLTTAATPVTLAASAVAQPPAAAPEPEVDEGPLAWLAVFVGEGLAHILTGVDHLLFVVSLALASRRLRDLTWTITAFTAGHSVSLALAALDILRVSPRFAEPAIAATIVWVAVDNVRREDPPHRGRLALLFGLIHGLGFGSALRDLGLPTGGVLPALIGFNVGVELGQLAVIVPCAAGLVMLARHSDMRRTLERGLSAAIAVLGLMWCMDRALDLRWMPF